MPQFRYRAQKGLSFIKGLLSAETREDANDSIIGMGFTLIEMNEEKPGGKTRHSPEGLIPPISKSGRQCRRIASNFPLAFHISEYGGSSRLILETINPLEKVEFQGHEKDISLGGICFSVPGNQVPFENFKKAWGDFPLEEILEPGSILELKMVLPGGKGPGDCVVHAKIVRVVYSSGATGERLFLVGAVFLPMEGENKKRLIAFCEARIGNP